MARMMRVALLVTCCVVAHGFVVIRPQRTAIQQQWSTPVDNDSDDAAMIEPNGYRQETDETPPAPDKPYFVQEEVVEAVVEPATPDESTETLISLLRLASSTGRGEFATPVQKEQALNMISTLEASNPTSQPTTSNAAMEGCWELVFSDTQLFRSSPFFMAGRAVCSTEDQAKQYDWFCDMHRAALAISNIGAVRQVVTSNQLISEFGVKVGAVPFLSDFTPFAYSGGWPVTIDGSIVSTADISPTVDGTGWEIYMDTVEIKGSNIPGVRQILDAGVKLQSRQLADLLESAVESYTTPKPVFTTTYLSDELRISRDQDGKVFVYTKVSDSTAPTDYSGKMSDLGVAKLLEGLNDAVVKYYI